MAWRCSGPTNEGLIENLWRHGLIKSAPVKSAFLRVDRAHYAPSSPYEDRPKYIGHDATISAPHMHASALENLMPFILPLTSSSTPPNSNSSSSTPAPRSRRVLDIGCGSGYLTHVIAELLTDGVGDAPPSSEENNSHGNGGSSSPLVVGLDHIPDLVRLSESNMRKSPRGRALLDSGRVKFVVGDGRKGLSLQSLLSVDFSQQQQQQQEGPSSQPAAAAATIEEGEREVWDAIHVGASAREIHPELVAQLRRPGRMFVPVDDDETGSSQHIWQVDKDVDGRVERRQLFGVKYVPLTDAPSQ